MKNFEFIHGADMVEDERNWKHSDLIKVSSLPISGACKLGAYQSSEVLMQNKVGICTAIAITQQAQKKYNKKYSSTFQYLIQKKMYDGAWYEGSSGQSALWVANKYGFLPYEILPDLQDSNNSITYSEYVSILESYTQEQINSWIAQCENKISGYASVNTNDYQALAQGILDSETGLYCTTTVTHDWYTNSQGVADWSFEGLCPLSKKLNVAGGHAITIDSFDSTSFNGITWANTWSEQWCWKTNYSNGGIAISNYNTVKPNQAWIIYWDKVPVKPNTQFIFNKDLRYGMANNDVKELQIRLGVQPQTGYFGNLTLNAVIKYQKENNIPTTGYVGKLTRKSLNNMKTNIPSTLQSSDGSGKLSTTVKGLLVLLAPVIISLLATRNIIITEDTLLSSFNDIITIIGSLIASYGLLKKVYYNFK